MLRVQTTTDQQRPRHAEDDRARHHRTRGGRRDASATQVGAESDASQRDGQSDRRDRPGGEPKLRSVVDNSIRGGRDHDRRIASAPARLKLRTVNAGPVFTRPLRAGQPPTAFAVRLLEPRHPASDVRRNRLGYHLVRGEEHRPGGWRRSGSAVHSGRAGVSRPAGHAARRLPACSPRARGVENGFDPVVERGAPDARSRHAVGRGAGRVSHHGWQLVERHPPARELTVQ